MALGKPHRIVHVATRFRSGGAERNIAHLLTVEAELGYESHLVVGADSTRTLVPAGVKVHDVAPMGRPVNPLSDLAAVLALRALLPSLKPDIVHTHLSKAGILGRIAAPRSARVVHSIHMNSFGNGYGRVQSAAYVRAERLAARRTDQFVSVGDELRANYVSAAIGTPDRYTTIRSPIDVDAYLGLRRQRHGGSPRRERPTLVAVGSMERRKRHYELLRWLQPLLSGGRARLVIAGEGPERARVEGVAVALGVRDAVDLPGYVQDIPSLLSHASVFVHSSIAEGTPQVVVQALAAGLPVVATAVTGLSEVRPGAVETVPPTGVGFVAAVGRVLAATPTQVEPEAFNAWRAPAIAKKWASVYRQLLPPR